jgi:hypothetical protein
MTNYLDFLRAKMPKAECAGFEPPSSAHPSLFPHQSDIAHWAIRGGRRAIFANFGLGKTRIHIQIAQWVTEKTDRPYLIICPLGVRQEFTLSDGPAMGAEIEYVRTDAEVAEAVAKGARILITNYERVRDGGINVNQFAGAGLDEASVLRSYGSKTYQEFLKMFRQVRYRFVFTATPSPNRYKELIHYGGFLGIMDTGEALTRFFQRDSEKAGNLTLYPHMEGQFWHWLSSWAVFLQRPSDLGYSDEGYDLPQFTVAWHKIDVDHREAWGQVDSWGQHQLFKDQTLGLSESAKVKRATIQARTQAAFEIVASQPMGKHWLLWHDLEDERREIERRWPVRGICQTVYGSQDLEERENLIMGFSRGEYRILATKPIIAGSGCNFQRHCSNAIYFGVNYKFNDFIQSFHRIHRFQQKNPVTVWILYLESEALIMEELKAKWRRHDELMLKMRDILKEHGLYGSQIRRAA